MRKWLMAGMALSVLLCCGLPLVAAEPVDERKLYERSQAILDGYSGDPRDLEQAQALLAKLLKANPKSALGYAGLTRLTLKAGYLSGKRYQESAVSEALAHTNKALQLGPGLFEPWMQGGYAFLRAGDLAKAREMAARAASIQPESPRAALLQAAIADDEENDAEIVRWSEAALAKTTDKHLQANAYAYLTGVYKRRKDYEKAERVYLKRIELTPKNPWELMNYSNFLIEEVHHYDKAIDYAKRALAIMDFGMGHRVLSEAYRGKGGDLWNKMQRDASLEYFKAAVDEDPENPSAHFSLGAWYHNHGMENRNVQDLLTAEREYARAVQIRPGNRQAEEQLQALRRVIARVKGDGR